MEDTLLVRRAMLIQHEIDLKTNRLIELMRDLVDKPQAAASQMEKHQIGNLLEVTTGTDSVELVKNFIQYQIGRDVSGKSWRANTFGNRLIQLIDREVKEIAGAIAGKVAEKAKPKKLDDAGVKALTDEIWIGLVRQLVGQMNRYFYYQKEAQRWSKR
jgi:hypothetical protein